MWFIPFYAFQATLLVVHCMCFAGAHTLFNIVCSCPSKSMIMLLQYFILYALRRVEFVSQKFDNAVGMLEFAYSPLLLRENSSFISLEAYRATTMGEEHQQLRVSIEENPDCFRLLSEIQFRMKCISRMALAAITSPRNYSRTITSPSEA